MVMPFRIFGDPLEARCEMSAGRLQLNIAYKEGQRYFVGALVISEYSFDYIRRSCRCYN